MQGCLEECGSIKKMVWTLMVFFLNQQASFINNQRVTASLIWITRPGLIRPHGFSIR